MRLTLLIILCCTSIWAQGAFLTLREDTDGYYTVTDIDVSGITPNQHMDGQWCEYSTVHSGLTIMSGTNTYSCSTRSTYCRVTGTTASTTDQSRLIASLVGSRIPTASVIGATGWYIETNNGRYCAPHPSVSKQGMTIRWTSNTWNVGPPEPVHCSITGPSVLIHPGQKTTGVSSNVRDFWTVRCSGTSAMTISTKSDVKLRSGSDEIDSGLYIGDDGFTSMDFTGGDYPYPVSILSTLKSSTAQPGSYSGSGIITITWP